MKDSYYPTTEQLLAKKRTRATRLLIAMMGLLVLVYETMVGAFFVLKTPTPEVIVAIPCVLFVVIAVPFAIWVNPRIGLYLSLICLTAFGGDPRNVVSRIPTTYAPVFLPINNVGEYFGTSALSPIKFSPFELLIGLTFLFWAIQAIIKRDEKFKPGLFLVPILIYLCFITYGVGIGLANGGDANYTLQESRVQYVGLLIYLLATHMITNRNHVRSVLWYLIVGIGIRSLLGALSYTMLAGHITEQGILEHEDSLIMNILFFIPLLLAIMNGPKKLIWVAIFFLPTALLTEVENNRRAGIAAFVLAFIILIPMVWVLLEQRRKQVGYFVILTALCSVVYLPLAWNSSGTWAMPARALRSDSDPNSRDAASNLYRLEEDTDLKYTRDINPFQGYGFGRRWVQIIPLPQVTTNYMYVIAHDSVLWLWMSLGHFGFFSFMMLMAAILVRGSNLCKQIRDPLLLAISVLAILFALMTFVYAKYDAQLFNMRTIGLFFLLIGILGNMPQISGTTAPVIGNIDESQSLLPDDFMELQVGDTL